MTEAVSLASYENLPIQFKSDVLDFIDFLYFKTEKANVESKNNNKGNGFGCLKRKISMMDDFDEPLEELRIW